MSVDQFETQTIAFTMSRSNFNNLDARIPRRRRLLARIFNKYQMLSRDFFSGFFHTCRSLQLVQLSFNLQQNQQLKVQWFSKTIGKPLKSLCGCFSPQQPISKIVCITDISKILSNYWIVFYLRNQFPRLLGLVQLHLCLQLLNKSNCRLSSCIM